MKTQDLTPFHTTFTSLVDGPLLVICWILLAIGITFLVMWSLVVCWRGNLVEKSDFVNFITYITDICFGVEVILIAFVLRRFEANLLVKTLYGVGITLTAACFIGISNGIRAYMNEVQKSANCKVTITMNSLTRRRHA